MNRYITNLVLGILLTGTGLGASSARTSPNFPVALSVETFNDKNEPIPEVQVTAKFRYWNEETKFRALSTAEQKTDPKGRALFREMTYGQVAVQTRHPGYYASSRELAFSAQKLRLPFVLRDRRNPQPMVAHDRVLLPFPAAEGVFELDWVKMDFLPPHGAGETADARLFLVSRYVSEEAYQAVVRMEFTGQGTGLQPIVLDQAAQLSEFKSDYQAPLAGYESKALFADAEGLRLPPNARTEQSFYFRIRTRMTPQGPGGYYGRFYGSVIAMGGKPSLVLESVRINPVFNSQNMEYDESAEPVQDLQPLRPADRY